MRIDDSGFGFGATIHADGAGGLVEELCETDLLLAVGSFAYAEPRSFPGGTHTMRDLKIGPTWACAALLVATLAACGDDGGGTTSGGGDGSGGQGDGGNQQGPSSSGGTPTSSSSGSTPTSSSSGGTPTSSSSGGAPTSSSSGGPTTASSGGGGEGPGSGGAGPGSGGEGPGSGGAGPGSGGQGQGGACALQEFFGDPTCDECFTDACCDEATACLDDANNGGEECVFQATFEFNPEGEIAIALFACLDANCSAECDSGNDDVCGTGLAIPDQPETNACIDENCCDPFVACFGQDGANLEACNECIVDGGGALCDEYLACFEENCVLPGVCGTDLSTTDPDLDACIDDNCCDPFVACFGQDGSNIDACNACVDAGGGPLCDDYLACLTDNSCE